MLLEADHPYKLIDTEQGLREFGRTLHNCPVIAVDVETSGLRPYCGDFMGGIAISRGPNDGSYIPLRHKDSRNLPLGLVQEILNPVFNSPHIIKRNHHLKFDAHFIIKDGFEWNWSTIQCTLIAVGLLDENLFDKSLKTLGKQFVRPDADRFEIALHKLLDKLPKESRLYTNIRAEDMYAYAASDTDLAFQLGDQTIPLLQNNPYLWNIYQSEMELMEALWSMEMLGVEIDRDALSRVHDKMEKELIKARYDVYKHAGQIIDLNADAQIADVLFNKLKLPILTRTKKTKEPAVNKPALKKLEGMHPIIPAIIEHNRLDKLFGTYILGIEDALDDKGNLHTQYNQHIARTGRLSSSGPNLQNIPRRDKDIRSIFRSPQDDDYIMVFIDQSQVELRVAAHYSREPAWVEAFEQGRDLHAAMCSKIFGIPIEQFSMHPVPAEAAEKRSLIKPYNFGELYGLTEEGIQEYLETYGLKLDAATCKQYHHDWWAAVPYIKSATEAAIELCRKQGYIENMQGRRRRLPDITSKVKYMREKAERQTFNYIIQGTCADMIKRAIFRNHVALRDRKTTQRMSVHDEGIFYMHKKEIGEILPILQHNFEYFPFISVPIVANVEWSNTNWAQKKAA